MDLDIRLYLTKAKEQQDSEALQAAYHLINTATAGTSCRHLRIAPELYVLCAEAALQLGCLEISSACLKMYFEGNPPANQFLCQALLCQGQLKAPPVTGSVEVFEEAVMYFLKAIEISKHERYNFMVFNASVLYFQTVRPLLQPGRCRHLVPSLRQVVQSLEDVADQDHSWRAELMLHLIECLVDSGNMEEAASFAKVTEEFIKSHSPHLYPRLFLLLVQEKLSEGEVLSESSSQCTILTVIYKIQDFKNRLEEIKQDKLTKEDSAKLEEIFHCLVDCNKASATTLNSNPLQSPVLQPADRVSFLLDLALVALQVKHQKLAIDCLKELKSAGEASIGQRIIMECINCESSLLKKEANMSEYSKASVEARLKEISKLDQWLQTAVRERDPQAVQAVCATQWNICLPLLQHNLRKHIKTPLLRVVQVLEDMQSMLLVMRCQVHSELAVIEEEEGHLEASLTHLKKAMLLDNGTQRERLSSAFRLLQLKGTLYQTPSRAEDKAVVLMQQARDMQHQEKTDSRTILVSVGLLLAPDDFQMVLDADDTSKIPVGSLGSGTVAQLSAKAQHHSASVQKVDGHLARQSDDTNNSERAKLWATLAKTARKQEVWDVCRASCRFCLLYDDGRWSISKTDKCRCKEEESCAECVHSCSESQTSVKELLRLLAEIHFVSAEATIHKLLTEGVQLNSPAVPPQERGLYVHEEDLHWVIYRDWIQALSAYATSNFLRAAELGAEIGELWVVANATIYLWNYNSHLLAAGEYQRLLPTFQRLVKMLEQTEFTGNRALIVLLCDAVAKGLIQPLYGADSVEPEPLGDKGKNSAEKGMKKAASVASLDPAAMQDLRKALELCEYGFRISNCNIPGETVPIAARKQLLATWVQTKKLLQQQIGSKIVNKDECDNEEVSAMMQVLVGVEMLLCNRNPGHMEFSVPSLPTMVSMASECSWTDPVVELQVWCQLAAFCHNVKDHSLVLCCTGRALQLEEAAVLTLKTMPCVLYGLTAVNEMLSTAACLKGLSLAHESSGNLYTYREAMNVLLTSVSYAEKADSPSLCVTAASHYWNTCLPLIQTPKGRWQLKEPLEKILTALVQISIKHAQKQGKVKGLLTLTTQPLGSYEAKDEDLTLRAAVYSLLLQIHIDKTNWKSALQLLDKAIRDMSNTRHKLLLLKRRILMKALVGESILLDTQRLQDEGEQCCSSVWHQVALCASNVTQQLTCYQKSITSLLSTETQWQKVSLMLEFGGWLYCHNFPKADAQQQVQWAIDVLLHTEPEPAEEAENDSRKKNLSPMKCESMVGVQDMLFTKDLSDLKEVWRLDCLIQAHTLLAVMADKTSPEHQLNLLRAYSFVLQLWQVSMVVACEIFNAMAKSQPPQPPPSGGSKKGKDMGKSKKMKDPTPVEDKPKPVILDQALPSSPTDWARYSCPDQARQIFRTNSSPYSINAHSIINQTQSLFYLSLLEKELHSLSLDHLILPIMHLAETIAHDLLDRRSLSDLYRLRIVQTCCQLGLETYSPYQELLLLSENLSTIQEQEQMGCYKVIALSQERRANNQNGDMDQNVGSVQQIIHVWLDKAEVCLSMGLYQPARQLLAEAHLVAVEIGDQKAVARSLLNLATLACEEQNHTQALILLDKAQTLGGDEEFWYQLTLTKVSAIVGQGDHDAQTKVDQVIKQGCWALKVVLEQQTNRVPELTFLITSLEMRGVMECIRAICGGETGATLYTEAVQMLTAACDALRECANSFTKLGYREQAAEAHSAFANGLRILANHTADTDKKRRFLLNGLSQMQLAVTSQEHVVLNAQTLLPPQEESHGLSLAAQRRLLRLRLGLADFCLVILEENFAEEKCQALACQTKTSAEIALEEFTCCTPEPNSTEQGWAIVGNTLGQMALEQLAAVDSDCLDNMETRARCLSLKGKYFRLMAVHEDPIYLCALWDRQKQKESWFDPKAVSVEEENSEKDKDRESSRKELSMTSARSADLQWRRRKAQQMLVQASKVLAEAINLCLQHTVPVYILADASLNMLECHGQSDPAVAGQYLALFQSCFTVAMIAEILNSACADTCMSQLSAQLNLHRKLLLSQEEQPRTMLRGLEDSLSSISKAFSHLTISPNHLNILTELPSNLKILLLQHSEDGSELYGAFYETTSASEDQKGNTTQFTGTLTCSRVAKVSVCPRALLALREQARAFGQEIRHALLKEACWYNGKKTTTEEKLAPHFREIVQDMEDYLNPLLTQFDFSCLRLPAESVPAPEMTKAKEEEEKVNPGSYVVLLADRRLLELPLESLSILQGEGLSSMSRDFSLQFLHSRLNREGPEKGTGYHFPKQENLCCPFQFWQYGEWVEVVVDDRLPVREGRLLFSYSHTRNEFWSALVEKAYAKLIGSYASLKGGNISEGMEDFTGGIAYSLQISSYTPQVLWRRLTGALSRGSLLSCFIQATSTRDVGKVTAEGLVNGHAYAITETDKVTKGSEEVLLLRLRNPWGFVEYCGPWSDKCKNWNTIDKAEKDRIKLKITEDGEFWISVEDFSKLFNTVELCNVNPESIDEENAPATASAWVITEHQGFWATGSTAGGSRKNLTFWRNPQFKLVLKEQDQTEEEEEDDEVEVDDEDDVETVPEQKRADKPKHKAKHCTVVVELLQKNRRQKDKLNFLYIGFHIYKAPPELQGVCLDRNFFVKNSPVGRSGKYKAQRGVWRKMRLEPGNYIIVVSTFRPHQPGEFFVRIYSKTGNTLRSHDFTCTSSYVPVMATPASPEDKVRVEKTFDKVAGQDDMLNAMEFMQLVNSVFDKEYHLPLETCTQLVFAEDTNGRASLNRKQTETLMSSLRNLQSMFRRYDADSSGTMSPFELGTALEALGMQCDIKVLQLLSQRFASGQLQMPFHGFVTCFTRLRKLFALYESETSQEVKDRGMNAWLLQFLML